MRKKLLIMLIASLAFAWPASALRVTMHYPKSDRVLSNPFIGNAIWANDTSPAAQPFTLVYANLTWAQLEPEEGIYDFDAFEAANHFDKWRAEGKRLILRFVMDVPGKKKHRDIPQWLHARTNADGKDYKVSYGRGYSPNYENPALIEAHRRTIEAIGARYDGDPFVAYVELGSLGHWGEWHVHDKAGRMPPEAVRDQYAEAYVEAFGRVRLMMRRPFGFAARNGLGLYNDRAGDAEDTETWLNWIERGGAYNETGEKEALVPMGSAWRQAPVGGELAPDLNVKTLLGKNLDRTIALFARSHASWIGPHSFARAVKLNDPLQAALDRLNHTLGYRLRVAEAALSYDQGALTLTATWTNDGNAPFYFDWKPWVRLTDASGRGRLIEADMDIRTVMPA